MSGRSKDKLGNALRRIFKVGNDKVAVATASAANPVVPAVKLEDKMANRSIGNGNANANGNNNNASNNKSHNNNYNDDAHAKDKSNKKRNAANNNNLDIAAKSTNKEKLIQLSNNNNNNNNSSSSLTTAGCSSGGETNTLNANIRVRRLMKEFRELQSCHRKDSIFTVELVDDNLYEWYARLHIIDPDSKLANDMVELNIPCILLHLVFPENFPFAPPFMRVVEPRIEKGYVMEGGAICMELLTPRGWASAYTIEAVLVQFAASVVKGQGRVMRKQKGNKEFSRRAAEESFRSLVRTHDKYGWVTPSLSDG